MTKTVHALLLWLAALSTLYASAAWLTGLHTDTTIAILVAIIALAAMLAVDHRQARHAEHDRRIAECRKQIYLHWDQEGHEL